MQNCEERGFHTQYSSFGNVRAAVSNGAMSQGLKYTSEGDSAVHVSGVCDHVREERDAEGAVLGDGRLASVSSQYGEVAYFISCQFTMLIYENFGKVTQTTSFRVLHYFAETIKFVIMF